MKKTILITIIILVAATIAVSSTLLFIAPSFSMPAINDSWLIAYNAKNTIGDDLKTAEWVQAKFGGTLVDIGDDTFNFNAFGQNIFIIGGSKSLAEQAGEWIGLKPEWYGVKTPDTYPAGKIYWRPDSSTSIYPVHMVTPTTDYTLDDNHDYGVICKGYDYGLRRWIVVCIGYSGYCTAYGAKLICTQWSTVIKYTYIVYQVTEHGGSNPTTWTMDQFNGIVIERG
jgi:hypothetical protein